MCDFWLFKALGGRPSQKSPYNIFLLPCFAMVSQTLIRSFHSSALRLNKSLASGVGLSGGKKFTAYLLGMVGLYGTGAFLLYEFYYKDNKIAHMFSDERAKRPGVRHL